MPGKDLVDWQPIRPISARVRKKAAGDGVVKGGAHLSRPKYLSNGGSQRCSSAAHVRAPPAFLERGTMLLLTWPRVQHGEPG